MAKAAKTQTITVKTNEENPEPLEVLAKAIIEVSEAAQKFQNSRLKSRAILVLIKDMTSLSMRDIETVLNAAAKLKDVYIKELPKGK
jgi:hypothetical protein